ncbi:MAG: hypothetical protein J6Y19_11120 [Kiritimatiellae bacterium]|nr:hypothetical protein [Kiritimatiellia bacterium]
MISLDTTTIAIILAAFFLLAAVINTFVNRARRRKIENQRAAQTGGGTEEAPIHLTTPFSEGQSPDTLSAPPSPTADESPKSHEDEYIWD